MREQIYKIFIKKLNINLRLLIDYSKYICVKIFPLEHIEISEEAEVFIFIIYLYKMDE